MATTITFNGTSFSVPSSGDSNWGDNVSNYLIAISTGSLQKTGGSFALTAELDFGATYGLKTPYIKSRATNPASNGIFRLGNAESISWRNAANSGDLNLKVNASDFLEYNGVKLLASGLIVNADIAALAAIDLSKLAAVTASRVLVSDASGFVSASSVTSTTLGYLDISSSLTTQLAGKEPTITTLPISKGGTNSGTSLNNNRVMQSSSGAIVEAAAITASRALVSDANGIPTHSATTSTELGYVSGVTSAIQTQLGTKAPLNSPVFTTPDIGAAKGASLVLAASTPVLSASAIMQADSTSKGFLPPRMTQAQRDAIGTPATGLQVYNTDSNKLNIYNGTSWKEAGGTALWVASSAYAVNDLVIYQKNIYVCITGHTAGSSFEADATTGYWQIVNSPQVNRNIMLTGNTFECNDTAGWQIGTVTLSSQIPSGAITLGTAASMSLASTATSPIAGKYSLSLTNTASTNFTAGQGIFSQVFNIDPLEQAKVLTINFAYQAFANATNGMSFPGSASGTWAIYIYDVTNSAWIQPAGVYNLVQGTGVGISKGNTFQTPSNMTQFRLALICVTSTTATTPAAGAMTLYLDDFYVGQQASVSSPAMGDWVAYTPTASAGFGTISAVDVKSRRVGDSLEVVGRFTAGTVAASVATITLGYNGVNGNVSLDTTKTPNASMIGTAAQSAGPSTTFFGIGVLTDTSAPTLVKFGVQTSTVSILGGYANGNAIATTGQGFAFHFIVPIQGWSSNTVSSSDTDSRVIAARFNSSSTTISGTPAKIVWTTTDRNDGGGNYASGTYTIPVSGWYDVYSSLYLTGTPIVDSTATFSVYRNGASVKDFVQRYKVASATTTSVSISDLFYFNSGDTLEIYASSDMTTPSISASSTRNILSVSRRSGPAVVQATESVIAEYSDTSGQAFGLTTVYNALTFNAKAQDTHNAFNGATGIFTAPVSGTYEVNVNYMASNSVSTAGNSFNLLVTPSGVNSYAMNVTCPGSLAAAQNMTCGGSKLFRLFAGQTLTFTKMAVFASGTVTFNSTATTNNLSIVRVGN